MGTYNYKKSNPFEQASALQGGARPKDSSAGAGGRGGEVRGADGVVGVAPYKRRTFTVEESRAKQKQQQESAVNITNSVVASIREKLACMHSPPALPLSFPLPLFSPSLPPSVSC